MTVRAGSVEYEIRIGLAPWGIKVAPRMVAPELDEGLLGDTDEFIDVFDPVDTTVSLETGAAELLEQAHPLAADCIDQDCLDDLLALRTTA